MSDYRIATVNHNGIDCIRVLIDPCSIEEYGKIPFITTNIPIDDLQAKINTLRLPFVRSEEQYQQVLAILNAIVESDGIGDYLEMGNRCIYCWWTGGHDDTPVHNPECIILKAKALITPEKGPNGE